MAEAVKLPPPWEKLDEIIRLCFVNMLLYYFLTLMGPYDFFSTITVDLFMTLSPL